MFRYNPTGVGLSAAPVQADPAGLRLLQLQGIWVAYAPTAQPVQEVIHPTGGEPLFKEEEEEVILTVINAFLFMRNNDGRD